MKPIETFQKRLDKAIRLKNIKPVDLHEMTGISESLISKYLSGNAVARQKKLSLLSDALDVNEVWLMGYDVPIDKEDKIKTSNNININGLNEDEIQQVANFVEFIKNNKKQNNKGEKNEKKKETNKN